MGNMFIKKLTLQFKGSLVIVYSSKNGGSLSIKFDIIKEVLCFIVKMEGIAK